MTQSAAYLRSGVGTAISKILEERIPLISFGQDWAGLKPALSVVAFQHF